MTRRSPAVAEMSSSTGSRAAFGGPGIPGHVADWLHAYEGRLRRLLVAAGVPSSDVDDLVQETFLAVLGRARWLRFFTDPWPYLRTTALRKSIDLARRRRTMPLESDDHAEKSARTSVEIDLGPLPEEERTALVLYFFEERTVREIARTMEVPEGTVKSWMARGRARLRDRLERKEGVR